MLGLSLSCVAVAIAQPAEVGAIGAQLMLTGMPIVDIVRPLAGFSKAHNKTVVEFAKFRRFSDFQINSVVEANQSQ